MACPSLPHRTPLAFNSQELAIGIMMPSWSSRGEPSSSRCTFSKIVSLQTSILAEQTGLENAARSDRAAIKLLRGVGALSGDQLHPNELFPRTFSVP